MPVDVPGAPRLVGLWGIDPRKVDQDQHYLLLDPRFSAATAALLWASYGKSWAWHPVWAPDAGRAVRALLAQLDDGKGWAQSQKQAFLASGALIGIQNARAKAQGLLRGRV
jgi:hypothetical protein